MKQILILLFMLTAGISTANTRDGLNQHLSPKEFRVKQQAFITEKANLTKDEAAKFFPVYFELQDKKKALNDKAWKWINKGKDEKTTDEQYDEIMLKVYEARIKSDELDKEYYQRFKKMLSPKKIYLVQRAEMKFHRELVRNAQNRRDNSQSPKEKK